MWSEAEDIEADARAYAREKGIDFEDALDSVMIERQEAQDWDYKEGSL